MKSRAFIASVLVLLVYVAFAEEASKNEIKDVAQPATKDNVVAVTTTEDPKQINQGGGGGGGWPGGQCGYGRQRYCCGGWRGGYCQSWCCRGANKVEVEPAKNVEVGKENDVSVATEEPKQINQGGGGGGGQCGYGRQRYCCGGWLRGYCQSWCCRGANQVEPAANHAGNTDVHNAENHKAASKENQAAAHKAETKN